jgi:ABC-type phosphate transport system substrate-binding protein
MPSFKTRRLSLACAVSALVIAALAAPSVASAEGEFEKFPTACEGGDITGTGATFQELAQGLWKEQFNKAPEGEGGCSTAGKEPKITYKAEGSGAGLKSWGAGNATKGEFNKKAGFVGTDEPPNKKQKEEIEAEKGEVGTEDGNQLLTIPVMQGSVAIIVHLPKGCKGNSKAAPGRIALNNSTLEQIFHGTLKEWKPIKDSKDKFKGKTCKTTFKRVVRSDGSGTTSILKKYLNIINPGEFNGTTWKKLAEANPNTEWPEEGASPLLKAKGSGGVVAEVAAQESTIGYVNMANARTNASFVPPTGGAETETFWAVVENGSKKKTPKSKKLISTYADPASNGEEAAKANANCEETLYTDGASPFPPASTTKLWNEVTTALTEPHYTICGFSYDLSLQRFKGFKLNGATEEEQESAARTARDYLTYILNGGDKVIAENHDHLGLPENINGKVKAIAKAGVVKIGWK